MGFRGRLAHALVCDPRRADMKRILIRDQAARCFDFAPSVLREAGLTVESDDEYVHDEGVPDPRRRRRKTAVHVDVRDVYKP